MFAPRQPATISETGVSVARFFEGTTPSGGGPSFFPAYPNPFEGLFDGAGRDIACLQELMPEMSTKTWDYLHTATRDGNYLTTLSGLKYIQEDHYDAFGHCWIACRGTQVCGESATAFYGEGREVAREVQRYLSLGYYEHNSYEEDVHNQRVGRELAHNTPAGDAFDMSYQALLTGRLLFHGHSSGNETGPKVYVCEDITLGGRLYARGKHIVPWEFLERF